jgi:hypothetical protein
VEQNYILLEKVPQRLLVFVVLGDGDVYIADFILSFIQKRDTSGGIPVSTEARAWALSVKNFSHQTWFCFFACLFFFIGVFDVLAEC